MAESPKASGGDDTGPAGTVAGATGITQPEGGIPKSTGPGSNNGTSGPDHSTDFMEPPQQTAGNTHKPN
ncbi:hypothetical protein [Streptomyces hydrogenans]|uniref:hypothetical protein n=1 Tax=Streptomyces hydrogenans TaxID=1873719 RepID=UPI0035D89FE3